MEEIQNKLQTELDKFKNVEKDYHKALSQRQMLESQLHENTAVKEELERLKPENDVFKLIGPVLVKQELIEVKQNVAKRMEYINAELKRVNDLITTLDSKQDTHREKLGKLQHQFQQEQAKVAAKA